MLLPSCISALPEVRRSPSSPLCSKQEVNWGQAICSAFSMSSKVRWKWRARRSKPAATATCRRAIGKRFGASRRVASPAVLFGDETGAKPQPLLGDDQVGVRTLLPADPAFDFAINTITYQPG